MVQKARYVKSYKDGEDNSCKGYCWHMPDLKFDGGKIYGECHLGK